MLGKTLDMIQIIATIGPSVLNKNDLEITRILAKWEQNNVTIIRFNLSHYNDPNKLLNETRKIQKIIKKNKMNFAIMFDTRGPEIRIKQLDKNLNIEPNDILDFTWDTQHKGIFINQDLTPFDIPNDTSVLIDDGKLEMKVLQKTEKNMKLKAMNAFILLNNKKVIFSNCKIKLNFLTSSDLEDFKIANDLAIDIVALSFVSNIEDIQYAKTLLNPNIRICSKIENVLSTLNLEEIIQNSDMVMTARGDLALEIGYEQVPYVQQKVINIAIKHSKPAIVATQLLESSLVSRFPSRSDVSDITMAIRQNYQFLMLSAETSIAIDPNLAPRIMHKIIETIQKQKMHMIK